MNDPSPNTKPLTRERGQTGSRVRFSVDNVQPKPAQQASGGVISPQAAIEQLKIQLPHLELIEPVRSTLNSARSQLTESNLQSLEFRNSSPPIDFPTLSEASSSDFKKVHHEYLPVVTLQTINTGDYETLEKYIACGGDPSAIFIDGHPLIIHLLMVVTAFKDGAQNSVLINHQGNQFNLLLRNTPLESSNSTMEFVKNYLASSLAVNMELLDAARHNLYIEALTLWRRCIREIDKSCEELEEYLVRAGLASSPFVAFNPKGVSTLSHCIKMICSGFIKKDIPNQYNREHIVKSTQGLFDIAKPNEIIANIRLLWKEFTLKERFIAVIMIKELLITELYGAYVDHALFMEELMIFTRDHLNAMPEHGAALKKWIDVIIFSMKRFKQCYPLQNYLILERWLSRPKLTPSLQVIDEILKKYLKNPDEQNHVSDIITHDLNILMLLMYKHLKVTELYFAAKHGVTGNKDAPNLSAIVLLVNDISHFVALTILRAQSSTDAVCLIELFIIIARKLCHSRGEFSPDLCSAAAILQGFDLGPLARLEHYFKKLSPRYSASLIELRKLFDHANNAKWLRQFILVYPDALPYLGLLQKDYQFIHDANSELKHSICMVGDLFEELNKRKRKILMTPCIFKTDLVDCVSKKSSITELELDTLSARHLPPKWMITGLSLEEINKKLTHYLENNIVPIIISRDNVKYEAHEIYKPLCDYLTNWLFNNPTLRSYENIQVIRRLIHHLFDVIQRCNPDKKFTYTAIEYLKLFPLPRLNVASAVSINSQPPSSPSKNVSP